MVAKSHTLGPGSLKFGETGSPREIAQQMTKAELDPNTTVEDDVHVLSGETVEGEQTTTWSLKGTVNQDFDTDSFEEYCIENAGVKLPFIFTPNSANERLWSGVCRLRPIKIGGDVKKKNSSDFEFSLIGAPLPGDVV